MCRRAVSLVLLVLACCTMAKDLTDFEMLNSKSTRCTYETVFEMYGAHCVGLRLESIPGHLKSSIEVLDFSDNKLKEIDSNTLSSWTNLKYLYLAENQIFDIKEDAFTYLTELQTLDLSKNVILQIPTAIFQLPNLQKLYLGGNPLDKGSKNLAIKTVRAPLVLLDISDCRLQSLPDWGVLPQLMQYNISRNPLTIIEPQHFANMCNLHKIDISHSIENIQHCNLKQTIIWFQEHEVNFILDDYKKLNSNEFDICPVKDISEAINSTYQTCKSKYVVLSERKPTRRTWLTVAGGLTGFLIGFILLLYVMHRHNVAQIRNKEQAKKAKPTASDSNATAVLLINESHA